MKTAKLMELLLEANFSPAQAETLVDHFSQKPHTHSADQITDFADAVSEVIEGAEEEEEDETGEDD